MSKEMQISVGELASLLSAGEEIVLIDIREPFERSICSLGGLLIPPATLPLRVSEIPRDKPVVLYCRSGGRSQKALEFLRDRHGYTNLKNLSGGIQAWAREIDPAVPQY